MIKDESEIKKVQRVVKKHFSLIKSEFLILACESIYPAADRDIFTNYSRKSKFHDKNVN
jgi:hypothetical protein